MTVLARPGVLTVLLVVTALVLHPAARTADWLPGRGALLAALLLLTAVALAARAAAARGAARVGAGLLAVGVALVVAGVAGDGLRGYEGTLSLEPGQSRNHFEETGPDGRSLGLRPLGFSIGLEDARPAGVVTLVFSSGAQEPVVLGPDEAVDQDGVRLARPRVVPTGRASRLTVGVSGGGQDGSVDLVPGRPSRLGELTLALEQYFPDFALDEERQPFTRSNVSRNPGALLAVESPQGPFRVFVLRAMPGVHRVEQIDRSFALLDVDPAFSAEVDVHHEPLAGLVLVGALLVLGGVVLERRGA